MTLRLSADIGGSIIIALAFSSPISYITYRSGKVYPRGLSYHNGNVTVFVKYMFYLCKNEAGRGIICLYRDADHYFGER